ncbi:biotin--[acetyl-CoA-carboxylase] ligase [Nocardioides kribbensis]|uniref:biotin--[acetyl-CoA-carboxylase] ligase n=1 Tax=Nocardioides kribbensis TaxID=305517 RepID=UPI0032D9CA63
MTPDTAERPPHEPERLPLDAPLDPAALVVPGLRVEVVASTPSTNALVAERARAGEAEGLVVVAEHQTAGRGRLDRGFEMPARTSLPFSVLLRPRVPAQQWPWLPLLTGQAVAATLRAHGFEAGVKWPNDVLCAPAGGERKLVGILVERVEGPAGAAAVVGIGLNVGTPADRLPVATATSLALEADRLGLPVPTRAALLVDLLATLRESYDTWQSGGAGAAERLRASYAASCVSVGRRVRVELPAGRTLLGQATGVDEQGRLVVAGPDGEVAVGAGDVVHARAL